MQTFYTFMSDFTNKNHKNMSEFAKIFTKKCGIFNNSVPVVGGALRGLTPARRGGG